MSMRIFIMGCAFLAVSLGAITFYFLFPGYRGSVGFLTMTGLGMIGAVLWLILVRREVQRLQKGAKDD